MYNRPPLSCALVFVTARCSYISAMQVSNLSVYLHMQMLCGSTSGFVASLSEGSHAKPSFYTSAFPQITFVIILRHLFCYIITDPHFDQITGPVPLPPARRVTGENVKTNRTSQDYDQLPPPSGKVENYSCRNYDL